MSRFYRPMLSWFSLGLVLAACGEPELETNNCQNECAADERCINGECAQTQVSNGDASSPDSGVDAGPFLNDPSDAAVEYADANRVEDRGVIADAAPTFDAAVDAQVRDLGAPDMLVDAGCAPSGDEVCDGLDNDCDGLVDEGDLPPHGECETGFPGICAVGQFVCEGGVRECDPPLPYARDACDQLDNDCDGNTDEDGPVVGDPCNTGDPGICQLGRFACDEVGDYVCAPQFEAVEETCDGRDNDCDGASDESDALIGAACASDAPGACSLGQQLCQNGALICVSVAQPTDEICNNIDDNCNGAVDEELPAEFVACETDRLGQCRDGQEICRAGDFVCVPRTPPRAERCDGVDDDCDGGIDEDYRDLFLECTAGVGACARVGQLVCSMDGEDTDCSALPGDPAAERCDGLDNDCDGIIDNLAEPPQEPEHCGACHRACAYPNAFGLCRNSTCEMGNCRRGYIDFDGDSANGCERGCEPTDPPDEVCDGIDNDCDGMTDGPAVCVGDAFDFCRDRAQRGAADAVCDTFAPGSLSEQYWPSADISGGADVPQALGFYGSDGAGVTGGGHTRRVPRMGPAFAVGLHVDFRSQAAVGVFDSWPAMPNDDEGPEVERRSAGYALWMEPVGAGIELIIRRSDDDLVLWRGAGAELGDGARHWLRWRRNSEGVFSVEVDGRSLTPSEEPTPDLTVLAVDRLALWIGRSLADQVTTFDDVVMQADADNDGVFPPLDNCPKVANPDQRDPDQNGKGIACDDLDNDGIEDEQDLCVLVPNPGQFDTDLNGQGDACESDDSLMFMANFRGTAAPWIFNLRTGLHKSPVWPSAQSLRDGVQHLRRAADGRLAWMGDSILNYIDQEGRQRSRIDRTDPEWLGGGLLYRSDDGQRVFTLSPDGEEERLVASAMGDGEELRAHPTDDGRHIVLVRWSVRGATVRLIDLDGQEVEGFLDIPLAGPGEVPSVIRHPTAQQYVVAALAGDARGLSVLDAENGLQRIHDRPTSAVLFSQQGESVYAIEDDGERRRVVIQNLDGVVTEIMPWSRRILSGALNWARGAAVDEPDSDGDGRVDADDACHDYGLVTDVSEIYLGMGGQNPKVKPTFDGYALTFSRINVDRSDQAVVVRLDAEGQPVSEQVVDDSHLSRGAIGSASHWSQGYTPSIHWHRGQYVLAYFHSRLENDSPQFWSDPPSIDPWGPGSPCVRPMTPDWTLGPEVCDDLAIIAQTETDLVEHDGQILATYRGFMPGDVAGSLGPRGPGIRPQTALPTMFLWPLHESGAPIGAPIRKEHFIRGDNWHAVALSNLVSAGEFLMEAANTANSGVAPALVTPDGRVGTYAAQHGIGESEVDATYHAIRRLIWTGQEAIVGFWRAAIWLVRSEPGQFLDSPVRRGAPVQVSEGIAGNGSVKMAWSGEKLAVVWTGRNADDVSEQVYFRTFDAQLNPLQPPIRLGTASTNITTGSAHPKPIDIAWDGRMFVVVWSDDRRGLVIARGRFDCF